LLSQDNNSDSLPNGDGIAVGTLHGAKGLELRAVAIVGCDLSVTYPWRGLDAQRAAPLVRKWAAPVLSCALARMRPDRCTHFAVIC
jgi:superfamily I DNA/RNA helicase